MNSSRNIFILCSFVIVLALPVYPAMAASLGTAFTYQGRLIDANVAADGLYDFQFKLFDANSGGDQLGTDINQIDVDVIDGYFTVELDFGSVFDGNERWLEIGVRPDVLDDPNEYTTLSPRQEVTPTPYALWAADAGKISGVGLEDLVQKNESSSISTVMLQDDVVTTDKLGNIAGYNLNADINGTVVTLWNNYSNKTTLSCRANSNNGTAIGAYADDSGKGISAGTWIGVGVYGYSNNTGSSAGDGIYGLSKGGKGVHGKSEQSSGYGIYGENTGGGYAGYFAGKTKITGDFTVGKIIAKGTSGLELASDEGTTRLEVNDNGNVGIGTGALLPTHKLTVNGDILLTNNKSLYIRNGIGSLDYQLVNVDSSNNIKFGAMNVAMPLILYGHANEIMRLGNGKVGIGVPTPLYKLELPNNDDYTGKGRANAWVTYSSRRWKTNIKPIENALEKVTNLRGVYFDWKSGGKHDIGMIAEEVGQIIPEVVGYSEDGKNAESLDYGRLIALLIEATKQQQQHIEELEKVIEENKNLKARLASLEHVINELIPLEKGSL